MLEIMLIHVSKGTQAKAVYIDRITETGTIIFVNSSVYGINIVTFITLQFRTPRLYKVGFVDLIP